MYHLSSTTYTNQWTFLQPSLHCSNHSLFVIGTTQCEYADAVWRGEESISSSSAGDHPHVK
ncbi:hypothetical protein V8B97DRAFT_1966323 [Scleroderma yunnanense]